MPITRRRLVCSLAIVLVWLGFIVEGSHALLTDAATLTANTINTGSVDLLISNSQAATTTTYADSRVGFTDLLAPGMSAERFIFLKNASGSGVSLDVSVGATTTVQDSDLSSLLTLTFQPVDSVGANSGTSTTLALHELNQHIFALTGSTIASSSAQRFKIITHLAPEYAKQNTSVSYDLNFNGTQHLN